MARHLGGRVPVWACGWGIGKPLGLALVGSHVTSAEDPEGFAPAGSASE